MRISAVQGQCDGLEPGALSLERGVAGAYGRLAGEYRSAGIAGIVHLLRFPGARGRRRPRRSVARLVARARARSRPAFLRLMAENAMSVRPPHGMLRDFATDDAPNAPRTIDLKMAGTRPFVDAARLFSVPFRLSPTTPARPSARPGPAAGVWGAGGVRLGGVLGFLLGARPGGAEAGPHRGHRGGTTHRPLRPGRVGSTRYGGGAPPGG